MDQRDDYLAKFPALSPQQQQRALVLTTWWLLRILKATLVIPQHTDQPLHTDCPARFLD